MISKKRYIYTIDDDCFVAKNPSGEDINALEQHIRNLLTPSTPDFFNTLYDPYTEGSDFVRGYPFSMREGKPTAVSHGLWLNIPDYDAPTQMVKPAERNTRYVNAVMTIPKVGAHVHVWGRHLGPAPSRVPQAVAAPPAQTHRTPSPTPPSQHPPFLDRPSNPPDPFFSLGRARCSPCAA